MVLNRTDFGKCWKSSQTFSNVTYMLGKGFLTVLEIVRTDIGRIAKGPNSKTVSIPFSSM